MKITWYGHAAFSVEGSPSAAAVENGDASRKVIVDPYNYPDCGGYLPINEGADVVCVSHDNVRYHSDVSAIQSPFELLEALEITGDTRDVRGIRFEAYEVFEDANRQGPNAMVKFALDGITVAHQGDLGHPLEGAALDFLRDVNVLLALAGGNPTIALPDLAAAIRETRPALVLPMHYKTPKVNLNLLPVEAFLEHAEAWPIERPGTSSVTVTRESLPQSTTIVVLEHAR